jgi:hypothetical protein
VHKSQVSRIRNNITHVDADLPALPDGLGLLRRAWNAAGAPAREHFLRWLWSEHPEMIGAVMTEPPANERHSAA